MPSFAPALCVRGRAWISIAGYEDFYAYTSIGGRDVCFCTPQVFSVIKFVGIHLQYSQESGSRCTSNALIPRQ